MKRLLLLTLAAAVAMSLVAVMGVRSHGSSGGTASAAVVQLALDLKEDTGWCKNIDSTDTVNVGAVHKAAICLLGSTTAMKNMDIVVNFNTAVDTCTNTGQTGSGLDANPDFVGLGTGFDCSLSGLKYPYCKENNNETPPVMTSEAFITCGTTVDPADITGPEPLAVITWTATAVGSDVLTFGTASVSDKLFNEIVACPGNNCLGATVTKQVAPPTPTPPPECDIGVSVAMAANPPALLMKVGQTAQIVDLSSTWKNFGHVTAGAPDATCNFANAMGASMYVSGSGATVVTAAIDPTKLAVRVVPAPRVGQLPGDVCLSCFPTQVGKSIGDCLDPLKGAKGPFDPVVPPMAQWTYMPVSCQEYGYDPNVPFETSGLVDGGCRDTLDNDVPPDLTIDWRGFSAVPDTACVDVQAVGLIPALRQVLALNETAPKMRQVEVKCLARGVYPLFVFGGNSQAVQYPSTNPPASDPNATNNSSYAIIQVTCTQGPEMVKDCDPLTTGIQTACNLWLMNPKFPGGTEYGTNPPVILPKADANGCVLPDKGKGCLAVDVWLKSAADDDDPNDADLIPECLGAWEHQVRYDHKIIRFVNDLNPKTLGVPPNQFSWLESTGRIANCTISVLAENWILEGCVTTDNGGLIQNGPCGDGIIEKMLIIPQTNDLIYRGVFRPTKDNGVITNIVDDNCEITDIYAEPMADTLPGGLTPICGDLTITVRMLEGDIDLDCDVDVIDDAALAMRYGASWGLYLYDQWYDLEPKYADQDIDIKDLQFVFGRNYSTCQAPIPDDQSIPYDPGQP
jgi:hypothetical protein